MSYFHKRRMQRDAKQTGNHDVKNEKQCETEMCLLSENLVFLLRVIEKHVLLLERRVFCFRARRKIRSLIIQARRAGVTAGPRGGTSRK